MDIADGRAPGPSTAAGEVPGECPAPPTGEVPGKVPASPTGETFGKGPATPDLERLLRWEDTGGGWRLAGVGTGSVTLSLVTCDGGEEMEVLTSTDPAVLGHVAGRARYP